MSRQNFSEKREAVYQVIKNSTNHPCAEWVYEQVKKEYPHISLGTVYRNIAFFVEQGLVRHICTVNNCERFDADTSPHTHFICEICGEVSDVKNFRYSRDLDVSMESILPCKVSHHGLFFYGKCAKCLEKEDCC